jgi:hypothetical protein
MRYEIILDNLRFLDENMLGLIGFMPLQLSLLGEMPLQKQDLEICHSNFLIVVPMPFCTLQENNGSKYTCISMCAVEFTIIPVFSTFWLFRPSKYSKNSNFGQNFELFRKI